MFSALSQNRINLLCALTQSIEIVDLMLDKYQPKIDARTLTLSESDVVARLTLDRIKYKNEYDANAPKTKRQKRQLERHIQSHLHE